ncbi:hypothetical protein [Saccharopolyspora hattusasensis]|uniref:hypothetical protein n=1 Tax=Saccharopolyspora hattusasensis TaxID=1128679 RepID=UPI003D9763AE
MTVTATGIVHGPWNLTWADHDQRHRKGPFWQRSYVLNPLGWDGEGWCNCCQTGVLLDSPTRRGRDGN